MISTNITLHIYTENRLNIFANLTDDFHSCWMQQQRNYTEIKHWQKQANEKLNTTSELKVNLPTEDGHRPFYSNLQELEGCLRNQASNY